MNSEKNRWIKRGLVFPHCQAMFRYLVRQRDDDAVVDEGGGDPHSEDDERPKAHRALLEGVDKVRALLALYPPLQLRVADLKEKSMGRVRSDRAKEQQGTCLALDSGPYQLPEKPKRSGKMLLTCLFGLVVKAF